MGRDARIALGMTAALICGLSTTASSAGPYPPLPYSTPQEAVTFGHGCDCLPLCESGCDQVFCDPAPRFTARVKFLYMRRDENSDPPILRNTATNQSALKGNDFDFGFDPGVDASLIAHLGGGNAIEGRFLWIDDWEATVFTPNPTPGELQLTSNPFSTGGFVDDFYSNYATKFQTAEVNYRQDCACHPVTMLIGFRWAEIDEDLQLNSLDATVPTFVDFDTRNDLFGGQIGLDAVLIDWGNFGLDGFFKTGIFANSSQGNARVQVGPDILGTASDRRVEPAILAEAGLEGVVWLTDRMKIRLGYQVMIAHGLSIAAEQVKTTGNLTPGGTNNVAWMSLDMSRPLFAHGGTAAFEVVW
ncbi:MAG: hypothetical protein KDA93_06200 [Planctomycetaceae bacterium]|nr:hypothetical protein [Planctomycetaceae bacterium]